MKTVALAAVVMIVVGEIVTVVTEVALAETAVLAV